MEGALLSRRGPGPIFRPFFKRKCEKVTFSAFFSGPLGAHLNNLDDKKSKLAGFEFLLVFGCQPVPALLQSDPLPPPGPSWIPWILQGQHQPASTSQPTGWNPPPPWSGQIKENGEESTPRMVFWCTESGELAQSTETKFAVEGQVG